MDRADLAGLSPDAAAGALWLRLADGDGQTALAVPWLQVVAIVVVATAAGLLASVLPARRAARISPVAAIAG